MSKFNVICVFIKKYNLYEIIFNVYIVVKNNDKNFEYTIMWSWNKKLGLGEKKHQVFNLFWKIFTFYWKNIYIK